MAQAAFLLGEIAMHGAGGSVDKPNALKWFTLAAEAEHGEAMHRLGMLHLRGIAEPAGLEAAIEWWRRGAAVDSSSAHFALGTLYREGRGVEKSRAGGRAL